LRDSPPQVKYKSHVIRVAHRAAIIGNEQRDYQESRESQQHLLVLGFQGQLAASHDHGKKTRYTRAKFP
jgi:hypothetical protein